MISSLGRRYIQRTIENLNKNDRISAWVPIYADCTETGCGFDDVSRSAKNISCVVCQGTGRVETTARTYLTGRVAWTDVGRPRFGGVVATEDLGDATVEVKLAHKGLMDTVKDRENAYLSIDGRHLRVMSVDVNRVEGKTTCVARCEIVRKD